MKAEPKEIIQIIHDAQTQIEMSKLSSEVDLREIGADSLDMMNIFLAVQEKFGVEVPDEEIENLTSVADICNFITKQ